MQAKKLFFPKFIQAFNYSISGLIVTFRKERAFRQEVILGFLFFPVIYLIALPLIMKCFLLMLIGLLWIVELINSAIERVVDRISLERHGLSKEAKDIGSAAVFLIVIMNFLAWIYVFWWLYFPKV